MEPPAHIGRYEVELLLGEGGIARVWLARDPVVRRQVAVKVLRDDLGLTPDQSRALAERVRQEARAAATVAHPGIVSLYDMGDDERSNLYLVFELVRGPSLRERLHEGPLPAIDVALIARVLGQALSHAHGAGLVHRGVNPENVMLAPAGPKLTDFGTSPASPRTPAYSAPEVLASGSYAAASDEFALACTMYEALTGQCAFAGHDPAAIAAQIASGKHAPPRSVLPSLRGFLRLDSLFARALAVDPSRRFSSCEEFGAALATELAGSQVTFLATTGPLRTTMQRTTRRWQNGVALVAVAVIVILVVVGRLRHSPAADEKLRATVPRPRAQLVASSALPSPFLAPPPSATSTSVVPTASGPSAPPRDP